MNFWGYRAAQLRSRSAMDESGWPLAGSGISRRALFKYTSGTAMVAGITREPDEADETPHRHTFSVRFRVTSVSPLAVIGDVSGRTQSVISTGTEKEDQHFHLIEATGVALEDLILSGTENNETGEHSHLLSIE
jgi:hypothetical protein